MQLLTSAFLFLLLYDMSCIPMSTVILVLVDTSSKYVTVEIPVPVVFDFLKNLFQAL